MFPLAVNKSCHIEDASADPVDGHGNPDTHNPHVHVFCQEEAYGDSAKEHGEDGHGHGVPGIVGCTEGIWQGKTCRP